MLGAKSPLFCLFDGFAYRFYESAALHAGIFCIYCFFGCAFFDKEMRLLKVYGVFCSCLFCGTV
jgi:hypothetical protein